MKQTKYYIYMTQNKINKKIYVGYHASKDMNNDPYLGSGVLISSAIKKYGRQNFKRYILYQFDNIYHALNMQRAIVNEEFLKRKDVYNVALGGMGGLIKIQNGQLVGTTKGRMQAKDKNGKKYFVSVDDPRLQTGQLESPIKGLFFVKDEYNNYFLVSKNDSSFLSGQLVGARKGQILVKTNKNKYKMVNKNDPRLKSNQFTVFSKNTVLVRNKETKQIYRISKQLFDREKNKKVQSIIKNTLLVKDEKGNYFRVQLDDPRYLNGELIPAMKNVQKVMVRDKEGNNLHIAKQEYENNKDLYVGITKNTIWINNGENQKTISKQQIIPEGWKKGRISLKGRSWINDGIIETTIDEKDEIPIGFIKGRLTKNGKWINNGKTEKQLLQNEPLPIGWSYGRISQTNDGFQWIFNSITNQEKMKRIEEPLEEGWRLGRIKRIHINNGVEQIRIKQTQEIPQGYKVGGLVGKKKRIKNVITGKERYIGVKEEIPQGWSDSGFIATMPKGSFYVTNGLICKRMNKGQKIPQGFWKGSLPNKDKGSTMVIKNQKIKQERVINIEDTIPFGWQKGMLNRVWISDGTNLKKTIEGSEIPIGWKQIQGVKWINDGKNQQKYIDKNKAIPDGWFPNMIKKI